MAEKLENNEEIELSEGGEEIVGEEKITPEIDSKYRLILLAAQRSKQLQKGAAPRVSVDTRKMKSTRIALEEFKQKKVHFELTDIS